MVLFKKRKGSILDIPIIIIVIFAFAFTVLIGTVILTEFRDINTENDLGLEEDHINDGLNALSAMDYMFVFFAVGFGLASAVLAFRIRSHPIFFFFALLLTIIFIILSVFFTNAFVLITENEMISTISGDFPLINQVMQNLPLVMGILSLIIMIALLAGRRSSVGGA